MVTYPRIWAIGNLDILKTRAVGFFCSTKCPGSVIVHIYDLARAMRDSGISVISGFHAPLEKECLDLLLRGRQPVVLCPARNIEHIRLPATWRTPSAEGRMLVSSPFGAPHRRPTADLAEQRDRFVSILADTVVIAHAHSGSKIDRLYTWIAASGKRVYPLDLPENADLMHHGVMGYAVPALVNCLLGQQVPKLTDLSAAHERLQPMALDNAPQAVNGEPVAPRRSPSGAHRAVVRGAVRPSA